MSSSSRYRRKNDPTELASSIARELMRKLDDTAPGKSVMTNSARFQAAVHSSIRNAFDAGVEFGRRKTR